MLSKQRVIDHFGSVKAVAEFFGIEPAAVYMWKGKVPHARELELMLRLPAEFGAPAQDDRKKAVA